MADTDHIKLLSDQLKGIEGAVNSIADDSMKELCAFFLDEALGRLSICRELCPQAGLQVSQLALSFASLANCLAGHYVQQVRSLEEEKSRRALITNGKIEIFAGVARSIALDLWRADADQEFLMSDMAEQVLDILKREGFANLPKLARIKEWIKPVAPKYASNRGRPRKSP